MWPVVVDYVRQYIGMESVVEAPPVVEDEVDDLQVTTNVYAAFGGLIKDKEQRKLFLKVIADEAAERLALKEQEQLEEAI